MLTLPFDGALATPVVMIALVIAVIVWMLRLAVGPFGHVTLLPWHQAYMRRPTWLRLTLQGIALAIMLLAVASLMGLVQFQ